MIKPTWKTFLNGESGAVTVDWVVLTAATCLMGAVIAWQFKSPQDAIGEEINRSLSAGTLAEVQF